MEIESIRANLKDMLELRGDDVTYIDEHGDAVEISRYYNELIELSTDKTTVFFALSKDVLKEWKQREETASNLVANYKTKNFILVLKSPFAPDAPSSPMMNYIMTKDKELQLIGGMLQVFYMRELLYNPMKHEYVPKHEKLNEEEAKAVMEQYLVRHRSQLPVISRTNDPIAKRLGLRHGDIVRITRHNQTSGTYYYYRCCV